LRRRQGRCDRQPAGAMALPAMAVNDQQ